MTNERDIFDLVCDMDVLMEDLERLGYYDAAELVRQAQRVLTSSIVLRVTPEAGQ